MANLTFRILCAALPVAVFAPTLSAQAIQSRGALADPGVQVLDIRPEKPVPRLSNSTPGEVTLQPGLFRDRRELTKAYMLRLKTPDLLQNHLLEAGVRLDQPSEQMHQGWEAPHYQLRGHFAGHWLSAAAHFAASDRDPLLKVRVDEMVAELQRCQQLNGGRWVGSIPEKYMTILAEGRPIWSPQYTLHKTFMGLFDAYRLSGDTRALEVLGNAADWFLDWSDREIRAGRGEAVYGGECAGMLELWADLYGATKDERYLTLASRYAMPDIFRSLLAGGDPLSNDHANASVPWIHGAARLYEVTGDARYRDVVTTFWKQAVEQRGMFATTGNNAGEFWIPPHQFGRFLGSRTQEHCTVYNMIRVAEYLFRWTGDARYADYIERALYNGILAQQNPHTGLIAYFLPTQPGGKKVWGTEKNDFWCCHGTLVQAQAMYEDLIYYRSPEAVTVSQFIPSHAVLGATDDQIVIVQSVDPTSGQANFTRPDDVTEFAVNLSISSQTSREWTLRVRQPAWAIGAAVVTVDGKKVAAAAVKNGFVELKRAWSNAQVKIAFPKRVTREPLPGDPERFALLDGPIVLAAVTSEEPVIADDTSVVPSYEHIYVDGRDWQANHYRVRTSQGSVALKPVFEIADEAYALYFARAPRK